MSPTLLEGAVALILLVVAWQIGVAIAPGILHFLHQLSRDVDEAVEATVVDPEESVDHQKEIHYHDTHHS